MPARGFMCLAQNVLELQRQPHFTRYADLSRHESHRGIELSTNHVDEVIVLHLDRALGALGRTSAHGTRRPVTNDVPRPAIVSVKVKLVGGIDPVDFVWIIIEMFADLALKELCGCWHAVITPVNE